MRVVYKVLLMFTLIAPVLIGCNSKFDDHYRRPSWSKGNAYEVLAGRGGYSIFLRGAELAGFANLLQGQGLCTVFAPNDEQMQSYLQANGWASIEDVPSEELSVLIGFHIVRYSYGRVQLTNFDPGGANNAKSPEGPGGLFYKQQTFGRVPVQAVVNPATGRRVNVFMREKYLPVLSQRIMTSRGLSDYEFNFRTMYPNSRWVGDGADMGAVEGQIYAANGYILPDGVALPTDNGFVYLVGEVLQPLDNIYIVMQKNADRYSSFIALYDRFMTLTYDAALSQTYGETANDSLYLFYHGRHASSVTYAPKLAQIASEWTFNQEQGMSYNMWFSTGRAFNAFVPDNSTLENYVNTFFTDYSIDNLPLLHAYYVVANQVLDNTASNGNGLTIGRSGVALPEEIRSGRITNSYGDVMQINLETSPIKQFCTNGTFYGTDVMTTPAPFRTVTKPIFQKSNYEMFLMMLYQTGNILQLTNPDIQVTLFAPTNDALTSAGITLSDANTNILGDEVFKSTSGSTTANMTVGELNNFVDMHIVFQRIEREEFNTKRVYSAKQSGTYIKTFDGGVRGEENFTTSLVPIYLGDFSNGITYEIPGVLNRSTVNLASLLSTTASYSKFWDLVTLSGLAIRSNQTWVIPSIGGENLMFFVPSNSAIDADTVIPVLKNNIANADPTTINPETNQTYYRDAQDALANYIRSYMVSIQKSRMADFIMIGVGEEGTYNTERVRTVQGNNILYYTVDLFKDAPNLRIRMEVTQKNGTVKEAYTLTNQFPIFATDGIIYQIETTDIQPVQQ